VRTIAKLTAVEVKLFLREPFTMFFTLALPIMFLVVLGGVFGNTPDPEGEVFRGVGATDYYIPAYMGLVASALGLISLPVHLAVAHLLVTLLIALVGSALLMATGLLAYDAALPESPVLTVPAFLLAVLGFGGIGILLGALTPTARAAQGLGLLLFFIMLMIAGAGPPREVVTSTLRTAGDLTLLRYVILTLQGPWLGFGWDVKASLIVAGMLVASLLVAWRTFRWE